MKQIPENAGGATWAGSLLNDINTIKTKLRYPIKGKTLTPIVFWGSIILLIIALSIFLINSGTDNAPDRPWWTKMLVGTSGLFVMIVIITRHIHALKFISIETPYHTQENMALIDGFLKSEHMLIFRHPEAPEIFQIQSRNVNMKGIKEDREVMIFIADDRRILINSHFTYSGWSPNPGSRHHKEFGKMLQQYIERQSHNTGIVHQTF